MAAAHVTARDGLGLLAGAGWEAGCELAGHVRLGTHPRVTTALHASPAQHLTRLRLCTCTPTSLRVSSAMQQPRVSQPFTHPSPQLPTSSTAGGSRLGTGATQQQARPDCTHPCFQGVHQLARLSELSLCSLFRHLRGRGGRSGSAPCVARSGQRTCLACQWRAVERGRGGRSGSAYSCWEWQ